MEGLINYQNEVLLTELFFMPVQCNMPWGAEYFMMDSPCFMGRTDSGRYEAVIDMLVKIRDYESNRAFCD
jgi:hypothetical protein